VMPTVAASLMSTNWKRAVCATSPARCARLRISAHLRQTIIEDAPKQKLHCCGRRSPFLVQLDADAVFMSYALELNC
jgi:hypothetical protein